PDGMVGARVVTGERPRRDNAGAESQTANGISGEWWRCAARKSRRPQYRTWEIRDFRCISELSRCLQQYWGCRALPSRPLGEARPAFCKLAPRGSCFTRTESALAGPPPRLTPPAAWPMILLLKQNPGGDRWSYSQSCSTACWFLYITASTASSSTAT